jgi:hypothetical protein
VRGEVARDALNPQPMLLNGPQVIAACDQGHLLARQG